MERDKSPERVREEHFQILGSDLGPLYNALQHEVTWLYAKWLEYRKLYAKSPERIDLLNEIAAFFFRVVQDVLLEDILLHLARLIDPPKSANKPNLTIERLPGLIADPALAQDVRKLVQNAANRCSFAREWRHRHLAYRDLDLAMGSLQAIPLPSVSRQAVGEALAALAAVLNRLERQYFDKEVGFEHFFVVSDAEALVHHLTVAARYDRHQHKRLTQGKLLPEDFEPPPQT